MRGGLWLGLIGCAANPLSPQATPESDKGSGMLNLIPPFPAITSFTKAVVGDRDNIVQRLPNNVAPYDDRATPEEYGEADTGQSGC